MQRLQNRCARLLTGYFEQDISSLEILAQLEILNITQRYQYFVGTLTYKCVNGKAPHYMNDSIICMRDTHEHNTRNEYLLRIPPSHTNYGRRCFTNVSAQVWNSLPYDVQSAQTISSFKSLLRKYLIG